MTLGVKSITLSNLTGDNIAVLMLSSAPRLSDYIQPICLDQGMGSFLNNTDCWMAGWGMGQGGGEDPHPQRPSSVNKAFCYKIGSLIVVLLALCFTHSAWLCILSKLFG